MADASPAPPARYTRKPWDGSHGLSQPLYDETRQVPRATALNRQMQGTLHYITSHPSASLYGTACLDSTRRGILQLSGKKKLVRPVHPGENTNDLLRWWLKTFHAGQRAS